MADRLLTDHRIIIAVAYFLFKRQSAFFDHKGHIAAFLQDRAVVLHHFRKLFRRGLLVNNGGCDLHILEQLDCHLTLIDVLRLIVHSGLPSPAYHKDHRDPVDLVMQKRSHRIDNVAFAAVLHIHDRHPSGRHMIAGRQCRTVAFIGSDHMMLRIDAVGLHQIIT